MPRAIGKSSVKIAIEKREGEMPHTDVGHAIIFSHHAVHLHGIGNGKGREVLGNARQQDFVLMVLDAVTIEGG